MDPIGAPDGTPHPPEHSAHDAHGLHIPQPPPSAGDARLALGGDPDKPLPAVELLRKPRGRPPKARKRSQIIFIYYLI